MMMPRIVLVAPAQIDHGAAVKMLRWTSLGIRCCAVIAMLAVVVDTYRPGRWECCLKHSLVPMQKRPAGKTNRPNTDAIKARQLQ